MKQLDRVVVKTIGTTAETVDIHGLSVVISNNSANTLYFKEYDGVDCTPTNGFALPKNTVLMVPFAATKLSMIASGASSSIGLMILDNY